MPFRSFVLPPRDAKRRPSRSWLAACSVLCLNLMSGPVAAWTSHQPSVSSPYVLDRVFMLVRHGIRAPLAHEAAAADLAANPWPVWDVPTSQLTAHGRKNVSLSGDYFRQWLIRQHVLPKRGCPPAGWLRLSANTDQRTIDSGQLLGAALLPGCHIALEHQPRGSDDPLYRPVESGVVPFDAARAIESIQQETGGLDHLVAQHRAEFITLAHVLGCHERCPFHSMSSSLAPSTDGRSLRLDGPINLASGTAEVLLLEYAQGFPMKDVGWGRLTPTRLAQLSRLHALLFDVYANAAYMAPHSAAQLLEELITVMTAKDTSRVAKLSLFVGSDTQIAAMSRVLGVHFHLPGYGRDDPSPGSALLIEVWRNRNSDERMIRLEYVGQSPDQLRHATPLSNRTPPLWQTLHSSRCPSSGHAGMCPLATMTAALRRQRVAQTNAGALRNGSPHVLPHPVPASTTHTLSR